MSEQELQQQIEQIVMDRATLIAQRNELDQQIAANMWREAVTKAELNRLQAGDHR